MISALTSGSFRKHLTEDLIPFWNKMTDMERGGFYGYADECGIPDKNSPKGCILNSRILWFYSASYNLLKEPELLEKASVLLSSSRIISMTSDTEVYSGL